MGAESEWSRDLQVRQSIVTASYSPPFSFTANIARVRSGQFSSSQFSTAPDLLCSLAHPSLLCAFLSLFIIIFYVVVIDTH